MQMFKITVVYFILLLLSVTAVTFFTPMISADQTEEETSREKCYKCHKEEVEYKEWERSGHAKSLTNLKKSPDAQDSCLICHSSGYKSDALRWGEGWKQLATLETAQNEVGCSSCHRHGSKREHYLIQPAKNLCASCHKMDCG
ncbi:TPA: hypothetical protein EYP66_16595 [Candidatus Poribacteria bacterium]|nr:hypothetical protein [Candidatus Poribacteria bacterium]